MKIVAKDSDGTIILVADVVSSYTPPVGFTAHDLPGWDWSLVDLSEVDRTQPDWIPTQLMWNGAAVVKRP